MLQPNGHMCPLHISMTTRATSLHNQLSPFVFALFYVLLARNGPNVEFIVKELGIIVSAGLNRKRTRRRNQISHRHALTADYDWRNYLTTRTCVWGYAHCRRMRLEASKQTEWSGTCLCLLYFNWCTVSCSACLSFFVFKKYQSTILNMLSEGEWVKGCLIFSSTFPDRILNKMTLLYLYIHLLRGDKHGMSLLLGFIIFFTTRGRMMQVKIDIKQY